jgi:hypothetical protein
MGRTHDNYDRQVVRGTSLSSVTAGNLISQTESGYLLPCQPLLGVINSSNATNGPVASTAIANIEGTNLYYGTNLGAYRCLAELGNTNIAHVYTGDGTATAGTGVNLRIKTIQAANVIPRVSVSSTAGCTNSRCRKINSTTLVVAWAESSTLKFAVYNNDGTVATAAATVATLGSVDSWNMEVLANGDIVFAYDLVTSRNFSFKRYNAAGVLQGSETTVEAAAQAPAQSMCVGALANGGFVIHYYRAAATAAKKFARYNSSGVLQGSLTTIYTSANNLTGTGGWENDFIELTGGNFVIQAGATGDNCPNLYVYDSSGTLLTTIDLGTTFVTSAVPVAICKHGTGFAVLATPGNVSWLQLFGSTGSNILNWTSVDTASGQNSANTLRNHIFSRESAGFVVWKNCYDAGTPSAGIRMFCLLPTGAAAGTPIQISAIESYSGYDTWAIQHSSGLIVAVAKNSTPPTVKMGIYHAQRTAVLGVALNSAAIGETITVATRGTYATDDFSASGGSFDGRTATVPGTRGIVTGSTAVLFGLTPST